MARMVELNSGVFLNLDNVNIIKRKGVGVFTVYYNGGGLDIFEMSDVEMGLLNVLKPRGPFWLQKENL